MIDLLIKGAKAESKEMTVCIQGSKVGILYKHVLAVWIPTGVSPGFDIDAIPHNPAFCPAVDFLSAGDVRSIDWRTSGVFVNNISPSKFKSNILIIGSDVQKVIFNWSKAIKASSVSFKDEGYNVVKVAWERGDDLVLAGILARMLPTSRHDLFSEKYTTWPNFSNKK